MILKKHLMICAMALGVAHGTTTPAAEGWVRGNVEPAATASERSQ